MKTTRFFLFVSLVVGTAMSRPLRAQQPTVAQMLQLKPTQRFVECDAPAADLMAGCKSEVVREGRATGWVLRDATGREYRRFMDTNRDNLVDQWRYFRDGAEVYRDIDSNFNGRADQFRWMNSGGTRWALDTNEDGRIDSYHVISAAETTREAVRALAAKDAAAIEALLVRPGDLVNSVATPDRVQQTPARSKGQFATLVAKLGHWTAETQWSRLETEVPLLLSGDLPDGSRDVQVYRNARAIVETGERVDVLQFAELVLVGRAWKLLDLPAVVDDAPPVVAARNPNVPNVPADPEPPGTPAVDAKLQALIAQLQKLDDEAAKLNPDAPSVARYYVQRADVLDKLAAEAKTDDDRAEWRRQLIDSLVAVVQAQESKDSTERLNRIATQAAEEDEQSPLVSYIKFRVISAEYTRRMQAEGSDFAAIQNDWLEQLKQFATDFPDADDTADALSQLAVGMEFTGKEDQAREFYKKLTESFPKHPAAQRSAGALRRIDLVGQPMQLQATTISGVPVQIEKLRGKVVLVDFWSTSCEPWRADLSRLKEVYGKYQSKGFEIVGIALDKDRAVVDRFLKQNSVPWPIVVETAAMDGPLATHYGILALPTQFLVDAQGKVVSRSIYVSQLEDELKKLLK
jgi:thiol-disulfide isomerase/thioredoxin